MVLMHFLKITLKLSMLFIYIYIYSISDVMEMFDIL